MVLFDVRSLLYRASWTSSVSGLVSRSVYARIHLEVWESVSVLLRLLSKLFANVRLAIGFHNNPKGITCQPVLHTLGYAPTPVNTTRGNINYKSSSRLKAT